MSILLLVVVLLVIAIVLSRLTWASQLGERRSIKHHEQAMDVLRSVAGRPEDVEEPAYSGQGAPQGGSHVRSSIDDAAGFPAPAGGTGGRAVPEPTVHREETIRILGAEPSGAEPPKAEPPKAEPPKAEPPKAEPPRVAPSEPRPEELVRSEAAGGPAGVEARQAGVGSPPSWEPAHGPSDAPQSMPDGDGEAAEPAIVFLDDDSGRPGPVTVPPQVADAMRHDRGDRRGNGDGWGDGRRGSDGGWPDSPGTPGGSGWGNGHRWGDEPTAVSSTLPSPPTIGDQDWASSRSEARSRSRARTRSRLLGRVLAPFVATGRAASGARDRLGARGAGAGVDTAEGGADAWSAGSVAETTADSVKVVTDETAEVPTAAPPDVEIPTGDTDAAITTAPVAGEPAASSSVSDHVEAPTVDTRPPRAPWAAKSLRRPRFGFVAGLAAAVVVVCVVVAVLVATMSTSSNKGQPAHRASPPASTAPAPPPSPFKLVSSDPQGAVYNVASGRVALSAVASGRVWLEVVAGTGPFGQVLWQGVLSQGQNQTITNDAPVWIRIGASSNVAVTVNGSGVLLPQAPNTYNLTFSHAPA